MAYFSYSNNVWEEFLKRFRNGVSYMLNDFTKRHNKIISRNCPYALKWLR